MRHVIRHQRYNVANLRRDIGRGADRRAFGPTVNFMPFDYDLRFDGHLATAENLSAGPIEDLSIALYDRSDGREVRVDFDGNPELYSPRRLAELQERFLRLLAAVADPQGAIGKLEILGSAERRTLLEEWNATSRAVPAATLPGLFAAQAAKTPDAVAAVFEGESLSYRELDARANRLAHHLRAFGVGPEVVVGLCVERSLEMLVGLLAILKAGGAYLPLDPSYPDDRLAFMLADSGTTVVVSEGPLRRKLGAFQGTVVVLDAPEWKTAPVADEPRRAPISPSAAPDSLAYVIYTSGSTGRPKGAMIPHSAIVNHMEWLQRRHPLEA